MAIRASLRHRIMFELDLCHGISQGAMAGQTEFSPGLEEIKFILRAMRIMALNAVPFYGNPVTASGILGNHLVMALETDAIGVF